MEIAFNAEPLNMINAINKPCQHMSALINNDNKKDFNLVICGFNQFACSASRECEHWKHREHMVELFVNSPADFSY